MEIKEYFDKQQQICNYLLEKRRDKNTQHSTLKYNGFSFWEASLILDTHDDFVYKKRCSKCGEEKLLRQFHYKKNGGDKFKTHAECKVCRNKRQRKDWLKSHDNNPNLNKERIKRYKQKTFEEIINKNKEEEFKKDWSKI